jgi:sec-independent protein translocase protein TatA
MLEGITPLHLVLVLVIALIVVGPGKLPSVGKALGESIREFRRATSDVKATLSVDASPASPPAPTAEPPGEPGVSGKA